MLIPECLPFDLPPRVRGALARDRQIDEPLRLTPACAGSTVARPGRCGRVSTYPRVCGEHPSPHGYEMLCLDLPPRVRGALDAVTPANGPRRLTPACAGSTASRPSRVCFVPTYPRVCGEHRGPMIFSGMSSDLPPRVRGAQHLQLMALISVRLTPACAGSTGVDDVAAANDPTYPRVCGEHAAISGSGGFSYDLPPRVRGAPMSAASRIHELRLTPACAGSTGVVAVRHDRFPTYPRVCGEHHGPRRALPAARLTPACAGSTTRSPRPGRRRPTYPRVCGEHISTSPKMFQWSDLPPRVRGARVGVGVVRLRNRLTPACAGSTPACPRTWTANPTYPRVCGEHTTTPAPTVN